MIPDTTPAIVDATPFDLTGQLPDGTVVLEASAGTGKTFAIAALATRYVAEAGVPLSELLLVTFTKAATAELRDRVRRRLVEAADHLEAVSTGAVGTPSGDVLLDHLADATPADLKRRQRRLADALTEFDTATISTIHGFCQQVLHGIGLAADVPRQATLLEDESVLREQVVRDRMVATYLDRPGAPKLRDVRRAAKAVVDDPGARVLPPDDPRPDDEAGDDPEATARLVADMARQTRTELARRKRVAGLLSHQDLLTLLRDAVVDPDHGDDAVAVLRARYRVALIDEFQDTDPVQWEILERAFGTRGTGRALILIGDPKQAIYAFRGADVRAYLRATGVARRHTLTTNWRSDRPVVDALNHFFGGTVYGDPRISHRDVRAAPGHDHARLTGPKDVCAPIAIRAVTHDPGAGKAPTAAGARRVIPLDVAAEVVRILGDEAVRLDGSPVRPRDIAVLVRSNNDAAVVQQALRAVQVPAVINGVGSVFLTSAARDWLTLLDALERPGHPPTARRLTVTAFLGWDAARLTSEDDTVWDDLHERLHEWADVLADRGVAGLLRLVTSATSLGERLLATSGGERQLTDLQHVGELVYAAQREAGLGSSALAGWLREKAAGAADEAVPPDEQARRLESDAEAVQILTVHRSKGLEFGIVLCPYLWSGGQGAMAPLTVAEPATQRRIVDVGPSARDGYATNAQRWTEERRGEDLRLLYVAATRARHRLVLWWVAASRSAASPLGTVLFCRDADGRVTSEMNATLPDPASTVAALTPLADACGGTVSQVPDAIEPHAWVPEGRDSADLRIEPMPRTIDHTWRRTSYSRLVAHGGSDPDEAEHADASATTGDETLDSVPTRQGHAGTADDGRALREVALPLAEPPGSAELGTMVHAVLEHVDFAADDLEADLAHTLDTQLDRHLVAREYRDVLHTGLAATLRTPLGPLTDDRPLTAFTRFDRLDEPRFELPLAGGDDPGTTRAATLRNVADLLATHLPPDDPLAAYHERLRDRRFAVDVRGYLNGAIDLVLRVPDTARGARFVVVDHKTNRLGWPETPTAWHYRPAGLATAMEAGHYPLQALMYAVALHRLLRWRLPGYVPEQHLGGVAYLFVRGMTGPDVPRVEGQPCGVFAWSPPAALVTEFSDLLDGRDTPGGIR